MESVTLSIPNINCNHCKKTISFFLDKEPFVRNWEVDLEDPDRLLAVEADEIDSDDIIGLIEKAGFKAELIN